LQKSLSVFFMIPVILLVSFVPLVVYANIRELSGAQAAFWGRSVHIDFFSYYKSLFFIFLTYVAVAVVGFMVWRRTYALHRSRIYIPLGVYVLFVLLSYIFSPEKSISTLGMMDMYQGVFVLVGYVLVVLLVFNLVRSDKHLHVLVGSYVFVGIMVGILAITQYLGHDFFRTAFGSRLILPPELESIADHMEFRFGQYTVYATMYNTNFVGSFAALMIPFSFALYLYAKKPWQWLLALGFFGLMVFVGFGSNSRAGMVGTVSAFLLMLVMFRRIFIKRPIKAVLPFVLLVLVGYGLNEISDGRVMRELTRLNPVADRERAKETVHFDTVKIEGDTLTVITEKASFVMEYRENRLFFYTLEGEELEMTGVEDEDYRFADEAYEDIRITRVEIHIYRVRVYHGDFNVYIHEEGLKVTDYKGEYATPDQAARIKMLDGYERMFSNRVALWTRSAPLLGENILIGAGPDMYALEFPQNDYARRLSSGGSGSSSSIVDKPHNMYLQIGINTGVISLVALLVAFGMYGVQSLKLYLRRNLDTLSEFLGVGAFIGVFAYLVTGFFNDQIISVAPLFYIMLGLGLALNRMNRITKEEEA